MELSLFARSVLTSPELDAKLLRPATPFTDASPHLGDALPCRPARTSDLALPEPGARVSFTFPKESQLVDARTRGLVLHFFANHELLALELMALALLRFPDAPPAFRMGLVRTMQDEQRHLALYVERMRVLGVALGEVPVNRFFWDCVGDMASPLDFVVRMSLTLEQANLDFATHYRDVFRAHGDAPTAAILDEVHRDEIAHVRHGVLWFERWRDPATSAWEAYRSLLTMPLTPSRAKGLGFDEKARRAAGLDDAFIRELKVYAHSKGRPPTLFWLNATYEEELATPAATPTAMARAVEDDLASVMMYLAGTDDAVWMPEPPRPEFLAEVAAAGFPLPQMVTRREDLAGLRLGRLEPWGRTERAARFAKEAKLTFRGEDGIPPPTPKELASKAWAAALAATIPEAAGFASVCASLEEVDAALAKIEGPAVIKASFGASGRHALRVGDLALTPQHRSWITRILSSQGAVVVEPWLERVADLSLQLDVGGRGVLGLTRFLADKRGAYLGHVLHASLADLASSDLRAYHEQRFPEALLAVGRQVAAALESAGYRGPAGVDAFLYRDGDRLALRPRVGINTRYTMGRVALALERRVHRTVPSLWLHVTYARLAAAGFASFDELAALLRANHPLEQRAGQLARGALLTSDWSRAKAIATVLLIGPSCACRACVALRQ